VHAMCALCGPSPKTRLPMTAIIFPVGAQNE
jgi:hypothetical protein